MREMIERQTRPAHAHRRRHPRHGAHHQGRDRHRARARGPRPHARHRASRRRSPQIEEREHSSTVERRAPGACDQGRRASHHPGARQPAEQRGALHARPAARSASAVDSEDGNAVTIRVRDNGRGIEPEIKERIFDMFVRGAQRSSRDTSSGLGVGLALARKIVELHGGAHRSRRAKARQRVGVHRAVAGRAGAARIQQPRPRRREPMRAAARRCSSTTTRCGRGARARAAGDGSQHAWSCTAAPRRWRRSRRTSLDVVLPRPRHAGHRRLRSRAAACAPTSGCASRASSRSRAGARKTTGGRRATPASTRTSSSR